MWKLEGYDTFEGQPYDLPGEWLTEEQAQEAAMELHQDLERIQPRITSGGQSEFGIQDRIFILRPDGTRYRFIPTKEG